MRFSFWPQPNQSFDVMKQLGSHVEQSGWDGIWLADHFMPNAEDTSAPLPEAWTTLAALAATAAGDLATPFTPHLPRQQ